ncbi:HK97 gp10 family phage protein [Phytomonospora endophytica]|uniref:HK97 gp10 family phage protein n=1 Tax=Phytomonospora endophytica TaxID=714109 RepID=A0A841FX67_9ACTN|nr:HK97 gp10 family phage protein [Phytomonospora endophytica]MBB6038328.1 hypothetical protein [Phytomonospora endophytica]GIG64258.1 hypothetical protein Pen01_05530 [Phytomonospora endophytica]
MTTRPDVDVIGAERLRISLRKAGAEVADLKNANAKAASMVAGAAASSAPRRTGRLAATVRGNRAVGKAIIRAGRASVPYALPIHWGWPARNIAPNPWVSEAARRLEPVWLAVYVDDLQSILDKIEGA